jgi:DNA-binding NarL/FixJ family response regulator
MIRVLLVDDIGEVRRGLKERLNFEPDIDVVGEAENSLDALEMAAKLRPEVVIMDLKMPWVDGIATTLALKATLPQSRVIMLSLYDDPVNRSRAKEAGAMAFIAKQAGETALLEAIRSA